MDIECQHHEVATAGQAEIDMRFDTLVKSADNMMLYKYVVQERGQPVRQDGHLHAQAALRRQRLRHAHAPIAVEGRQAALRRRRIRRAVADGAVLHRRHAQARPALSALIAPDDQLLQAAGAGLRSAGQPGLLAPQPLGRRAHPDVLGDSPRPSASNSVRRIRAAIRTSRSPPC